MDVINIVTNEIRLSIHVPGTEFELYPWVKLQDVNFSEIGVLDVSTFEGKMAIQQITRGSYIIEDLIARWKTRDELYDFEEEKIKKIEEAKSYGRGLIINKILDLSEEMGKGLHVENALWIQILQDGRRTTLKNYSNTVRTAVISKIQEINECETWEALDNITIP